MDRKAENELNEIKSRVREVTSDMDLQTAAEYLSNLADWAYAQYEGVIIDDEPETTDNPDE